MRLFHFVQMPFRKAWTSCLPWSYTVFFSFGRSTNFGAGKLWIQITCTPFRDSPIVTSCLQKWGLFNPNFPWSQWIAGFQHHYSREQLVLVFTVQKTTWWRQCYDFSHVLLGNTGSWCLSTRYFVISLKTIYTPAW